MKWGELKKLGVKRCCAMFRKGGQCRRRAVAEFDFDWCAKHGPTMKSWENFNKKVLADMARSENRDEYDDSGQD